MKLNAVKLGTAIGLVWALAVLVLTITSLLWGYGTEIVDFLSKYYLGYKNTILGTIIGLVWSFLDGFIGGFLVAWIYNKL